MPDTDGSVLIAAPDDRAADYAAWLADWSTETAADADELLAAATPETAVVVLAQALADEGVAAIVDALRANEIDRPVVLLAESEPEADDVGLRSTRSHVTPVDEDALLESVADAAEMSDEDVQKQEYLSLAASQAALELELSPTERTENDTYAELTDRMDALRSRADVPIEELQEQVANLS